MSMNPEGLSQDEDALEGVDDDFDSDLGDGRKSGHVAPILPPA